MTISTEAIKTSVFDGNGSTTAFAFAFKTFLASDLVVTLTRGSASGTSGAEEIETLTTDYTVALNSNQDSDPGGTVTMVVAPAAGSPAEKLVISNEAAYTQGVDLVSGGAFNANVIEDAIDRNTILARRAQELTTRSIQIPITDDTGTTVELPTETLRASKAIVFDSSGNIGVSVDNYVDQAVAVAASATAAASSASSSASSATASASSASSASTSAAAAATSYDNFDDRFLGAKSSDPATDNDGDALVTGTLYFNSSNNVMMAYTGSAWIRIIPTSSDQTNINTLSASAVIADMDLLGTSANVAAMALLGTSDAIADMNVLGTADVVTDLNTLGTADVVADMNVLGTADVVTDMNVLATADVVADMNVLATADVVADMNTLGTADVVADMNTLGTADVVTDMNVLATADVVNDMNVLGTSANVTAMNTLGTSANVTAMSTVSGAIANVNTTATNIASVNNFAEVYRIDSSDPSTSLNTGDLVFRTDTNAMRVLNSSGSWQNVAPISTAMAFGTVSVAGQSNVVADSTSDTMTLVGSGATSITTNAGTDTVTISSTAGASVGLVLALG